MWKLFGIVVVLIALTQWSRADYLKFDAEREAWHRRCDAYVGVRVSLADVESATNAKLCKQELEELTAYATRKGWMK